MARASIAVEPSAKEIRIQSLALAERTVDLLAVPVPTGNLGQICDTIIDIAVVYEAWINGDVEEETDAPA